MFKGEYEIIVNPNTKRERVYKYNNTIIRMAKTITFGRVADSPITTLYAPSIEVWVYRYEIDDDTFRNIYYATDRDDIPQDLSIGWFNITILDEKIRKNVFVTTDTQIGPIDLYGVYLEWYNSYHHPHNNRPLAISRIDPPISLTASDTYVIRYSIKMEW